jgi:hypothetical protein
MSFRTFAGFSPQSLLGRQPKQSLSKDVMRRVRQGELRAGANIVHVYTSVLNQCGYQRLEWEKLKVRRNARHAGISQTFACCSRGRDVQECVRACAYVRQYIERTKGWTMRLILSRAYGRSGAG